MIGIASKTDLRIDPIIGWRAWRIPNDEMQLYSICFRDAIWIPGRQFEAHHAPERGGTTGIYSFRTLDDAIEEFGVNAPCVWSRYVLGSVALWGRVVEHALGYRAQFAYPRSFVIMPDDQGRGLWADPKQVQSLASMFGCDVLHYSEPAPSPPTSIETTQNRTIYYFDRRQTKTLHLQRLARRIIENTNRVSTLLDLVSIRRKGNDGAVMVLSRTYTKGPKLAAVFAANVSDQTDGTILAEVLGEWARPYKDPRYPEYRRRSAWARIFRHAWEHVDAAREEMPA